MKFTKASVEKIELPKAGERLIIWDSEQPGFGLRVTPSGKMYIAQSRVNGRTRRVSLGRHGVITLDQARKKAQQELARMLDGKDPVTEKKRQEVMALTLRDATRKYLEDRRGLKERSRKDIQRHINYSFSAWADKPILEITREKVAVRFRELTEKSPAQANQAFRLLRAILNYSMGAFRPGGKPMLLENPVKILSDTRLWNKINARSGRIPTDKVGAAWNALQGLRKAPEQTAISRTLADATAFLLFTGARWSEAAKLEWENVNLDESWWDLPDPKNRHPVKCPLSHVAREILKARPRTSKFVFPARTGTGHIQGARGIMAKISKAIATPITPHDLRRTFRAIAGECGLELWKAKLLMNHRLNQDVTIGHYTETSDLRYLADEINMIADWITRKALEAAGEKVVPLTHKSGR